MSLAKAPIQAVNSTTNTVDSLLTSYVDGAGLACGVFEYFLHLGDDRPKVLGATHFHEIFENGFLRPRPFLAFGYMEVRIDRDAQDVEDQITYLYKYGNGPDALEEPG